MNFNNSILLILRMKIFRCLTIFIFMFQVQQEQGGDDQSLEPDCGDC